MNNRKHKLTEQPKLRQAFTLIELLVVISIIALLLGIIVPVLGRVRRATKKTVCRTNLRSIGTAFKIYLDDNSDTLPPAAMKPSEPFELKPPITDFLLPYLSDPEAFKCPSDKGQLSRDGQKYFESEGSSYEYNSILGGMNVNRFFLSDKFDEKNIHLMRDYTAFHHNSGKGGAFNYLYADGHVSGRESQ